MLRLLKISGLLIGIISFNGCGNLPEKPSIDSGIIISEENIIYYVNNQTGEEKEVPVCINNQVNPELNKHIDHSNKDWNKILLYIRLLENNVSPQIREELKKYRLNFENLTIKLMEK